MVKVPYAKDLIEDQKISHTHQFLCLNYRFRRYAKLLK